MKSEKGITLMSLAIYIVVVLIIISMLIVIRTNFQSGIKEINKQGNENSELGKFNIYFLQEVKKQGNNIKLISESKNEIVFTTGNKYIYKENKIYLENEIDKTSIIIANDINKCEFSKKIENGKNIVSVDIQIDNTDETIEYVLSNEENYIKYDEEDAYIYNQNNI